MRLLIACVDAMCPMRVRREGPNLPWMHALACGGSLFDVGVPDDPCTPEIWTSFATALPAEAHGVRELTINGSGDLWRADAVPAGHLPDVVLNTQGLTTGLFNLPVVAFPPRATAGWMASGDMLYPQHVYPQCLRSRLEPYPGPLCNYDYPEGPDALSEKAVRDKHDSIFREFAQRGHVSTRNLIQLIEWLAPDVVMAYWHFLDSIQHHMLCDDERISAGYRIVDEMLEELTERFSPERILVVSDHGMQPPRGIDGNGTLVRIGDRIMMETRWGGHRHLISGEHSTTALCAASWSSDPGDRPGAIHEVLPWALRAAGIDWMPVAEISDSVDADDDIGQPEKDIIMQRLRELGYG